jgi:hypothetical protein
MYQNHAEPVEVDADQAVPVKEVPGKVGRTGL